MLESVLSIGIGGVAIYLVVGVSLLVPIHLRALSRIDPACAGTPWLFRALLSPGLITFWPLILLRWRDATLAKPTSGSLESSASPRGLQKLHATAALLLAIVGPVVMVLTLTQRGESHVFNDFPASADLEAPWLQRGLSYGRIFPSVAANVYVARTTSRLMGLEFDFEEETTTRPVALYWAREWSNSDVMPHDAVFLGIVSGPENTWLPFPDRAMSGEGFWIVYSFVTHDTEFFQIPSANSMVRTP